MIIEGKIYLTCNYKYCFAGFILVVLAETFLNISIFTRNTLAASEPTECLVLISQGMPTDAKGVFFFENSLESLAVPKECHTEYF